MTRRPWSTDDPETQLLRRGSDDFGPLFAESAPAARRTDPATSHAAAEQNRASAGAAQRNAILRVLLTEALSADGIDAHFAWREGTASRRLAEMDVSRPEDAPGTVRLGWVYRPGLEVRTRTGSMAKLWDLTEQGRVIARRLAGTFDGELS